MKKRLMTGFTPTGKLHLGHYVGNLENLLKLKSEYDAFLILADVHALGTPSFSNLRYAEIQGYTIDVTRDLLSVGLSEDEVTYYVESEIPEIYELAALFSMYVSHNRALRNPTIKDEIKVKELGDQFSLGFVNYPMYQAADILCVKGEMVPVGKDQEAHLEQAREISKTFNMIGKNNNFPEIKTLIGRVGKLIGTDGNPKMSKSLGNTIFLSASPEEVEKKVMNMYTDPKRIHSTDPGTVEGNPLFIYLDAFSAEVHKNQIEQYKELYKEGKVGDVELKKYLISVLNEFLEPIRERRKQYDDAKVLDILKKGTEKAREEAKNTLREVKETLKLIY
ncbi:MAG: tryptophan--tRNA ligase [Candidatus Levybacteria bacterium CG_4_10_14_0_2_um_filter_36_16]|nr:MAG: tryptophan--tRNA ligase [Candidatus Levybacteria bacterium CG2_30_37_29]PIZ97050.1 MAG: tryptophan--tRNA ligase [Candidatus Levybacteria bacterium CG_4_10_14_0_2_um_filter_36_16]